MVAPSWRIADRPPSVEQYNALRQAVGWCQHPADIAARSLARSVASCCAVADDRIVGMARAVGDELYVFIVDVAVHPAHQRRGIGTALIARLLDLVPREYAPILGLHSSPQGVRLYERAGFRRDPEPFLTISPEG